MDDEGRARVHLFAGVLSSVAHRLVGELATAHALVGDVSAAHRHLAAIVDELKDMGRLGERVAAVPVDLHAIVDGAIADARQQPKWRGVRFLGAVALDTTLDGDSRLISRALGALVGNAADACVSLNDSAVTISAENGNPGVKVSVRQTAPLPADDRLDRLLSPDFSSTKRVSGLGIGIPRVITIATAHRGTLEANAERNAFVMNLKDPEKR